MAALEAEVGWGFVAEELVGADDDVAIDGDHAVVVAEVRVGRERERAEVLEPVEAPFEGADDAVGVAGGKGCLPGVHPLCVKP